MHEKKSFTERAEEFLSGKGFYIVLFVCIAVIGVSAWLLLFSQHSPLNRGDEGDYLDAMADAENASSPIDIPKDEGQDTQPDDNAGSEEPEHDIPAPIPNAKPNTGALTVEDKGNDKDDAGGSDTPDTDEPEEEDGSTSSMTIDDISFIWPVSGSVTMKHSPASLTYDQTMGDWRTHSGIDIAVKLGTKVMSAANGTVTDVYDDDYYGTIVVIDHGAGVVGTYANLAGTPTVKVGDAVTMGSVIGSVGNTALYETGTAAHLHFAMTVNGTQVDPTEYLPRK